MTRASVQNQIKPMAEMCDQDRLLEIQRLRREQIMAYQARIAKKLRSFWFRLHPIGA